MTAISVRAPAKVNLQLFVASRYPDGYHELVTLMQAVSLFDVVTVRPARRYRVSVVGKYVDGVPVDETNSALHAAHLLGECSRGSTPVHIHIRKNIPVAAGMAGGTADAAATLLACNRLWHTEHTTADLLELASRLGFDGPFCLHGGTAIVGGRGERIRPVLVADRFEWVFAASDAGLSTAQVFDKYDHLHAKQDHQPVITSEAVSALRTGDTEALGRLLRNDLEPAVFSMRPELPDLLQFGTSMGAVGSIVCGSGPTCAFLARDHLKAAVLADVLSASGLFRSVYRAHALAHHVG